MIDLQMGAAAIFKEFSDKQGVRRAIRKAISSGVKVEMTSTVDDVAEFYAVYLDWAKEGDSLNASSRLPGTIFFDK